MQPLFINIDGNGIHFRGRLQPNLDIVEINELAAGGKGSRVMLFDVLLPAFEKSQGVLEAVLIWDGGDSIEYLTVRDGQIERQCIDLLVLGWD